MKKKNNLLKKYDNFYGSVTTGAGTRVSSKNFFSYSKSLINEYKKSIKDDLKRAKIKLKKNYSIFDIGTGRQALAFTQLSDGTIDHFDLSKIHVAKTLDYKKKNKIKNLNSRCANFDNYVKLKIDNYDLIYLQGIIQHFKNPQKSLEQILNSLKLNGYAWLYIYKSGTFRQFIDHMIRQEIKKIFTKKLTLKKIKLIKKKLMTNKNIINLDYFIDCAFTKYSWLYNNNDIFDCFEKSGFEIISKKSCYKKNQCFDHNDKWGAFIFSIKRIKKQRINLNSLNSSKSIKENSIKNYKKDISIEKTKNLFNKKIEEIKTKDRLNFLFKFYEKSIRINTHKNYKVKHKKIQEFLIKN